MDQPGSDTIEAIAQLAGMTIEPGEHELVANALVALTSFAAPLLELELAEVRPAARFDPRWR